MSTTKRAKAARMAAHAKAKKQREMEKMFGTLAKRKPRKEFKEYQPKENPNVRETPHYPSLTTSINPPSTARNETKQYTGSYITGIATMHKSNLVPVSRDTDPKIYATMRRN